VSKCTVNLPLDAHARSPIFESVPSLFDNLARLEAEAKVLCLEMHWQEAGGAAKAGEIHALRA